LFDNVTLIVAAAVVEASRSAVTVASTVADAVSPALRIDVAVVATLSSAAAAVTVIVRVCAVAPRSVPLPPIAAGVTRTT